MAFVQQSSSSDPYSDMNIGAWNSTSNSSNFKLDVKYVTNNAASTTSSISGTSPSQSQGQTCNESKKHDNDQKAVFHGMKSAYRMSRHSTGEYGSQNPQREHAAHTAAHVGIAFMKSKDYDYDRERSLEDIEDRHMADDGVIDSLVAWLKDDVMPDGGEVNRGPLTDSEFEEAIKRAWDKIDNENHKAGARVAIAAAEAYLGEKMW